MSTSPSRMSCWRLGALAPPHFDVWLDLIELLEGTIEVERIELIAWHAVGEQREDQGPRRIA
jgi:hypothetical protein